MLTAKSTGSRLVTTTEAGELLGVSRPTILAYIASGELESVPTIGGHNRVTLASVNRYMGFDDDSDSEAGRKVYVYLRVSSQKQKADGNLSRQRERMVEWTAETFQVEAGDVVLVEDCASAFGTRPGLQRIIDAVIDGKVSHLVAEFSDRLSRTSSEKRLIEHLCERYGVEIRYAKKAIDVAESQILVTELTEFITVVSNKISGRKGGESVRMVASEASKTRILALNAGGMTQDAIVEQMHVENHRCEKTGKFLSIHIVRNVIIDHQNAERLLTVAPAKIENPITKFVAARCELKADGKCFSTPLYNAYAAYCEANGVDAMGKHCFTRYVGRHFGLTADKSSSGYTYLTGLALVGNERASRSHLA